MPTARELTDKERAIMRAEWAAWGAVCAALVNAEAMPGTIEQAGKHRASGCECLGCRAFAAIREWGAREAERVEMEHNIPALRAAARAVVDALAGQESAELDALRAALKS